VERWACRCTLQASSSTRGDCMHRCTLFGSDCCRYCRAQARCSCRHWILACWKGVAGAACFVREAGTGRRWRPGPRVTDDCGAEPSGSRSGQHCCLPGSVCCPPVWSLACLAGGGRPAMCPDAKSRSVVLQHTCRTWSYAPHGWGSSRLFCSVWPGVDSGLPFIYFWVAMQTN
jgi:hypothetical protein